MRLEKVKKIKKGLLIALVAGVVISQAAPAIHSGTRAHADDDSNVDDTSVIMQANEDEEELLLNISEEESSSETSEAVTD